MIVREVEKNVWPAVTAGYIKPIIHKKVSLEEVVEAHRLMESSKLIGKILFLVP